LCEAEEEEMSKSKFYTFHQNNSGGSYDVTNDVACEVIIEATDADDANRRAELVGIYFNGCADEIDCSCCGDRWSEVYEDDGKDTPMIYDDNALDHEPLVGKGHDIYCVIHYIDGRRVQLFK
jgi:hypothetical protein